LTDNNVLRAGRVSGEAQAGTALMRYESGVRQRARRSFAAESRASWVSCNVVVCNRPKFASCMPRDRLSRATRSAVDQALARSPASQYLQISAACAPEV